MSDPVIAHAIKLRDRLLETAKEIRIMGNRSDRLNTKRMAEIDARGCEDAAAMLAVLGTEVTRYREGIGCCYYGREPDVRDMWRWRDNWNGKTHAQVITETSTANEAIRSLPKAAQT